MTTLFFTQMLDATFFSRSLIVLIISAFMPLTAMSYFWFMVKKKESDYRKALGEMGLHTTSRKVRDYYSPAKYLLPVTFAFLICFLSATYFTFVSQTFLESTSLAEGTQKIKDSLWLSGAWFGGSDNDALMFQSLAVLSWAFMGGFIWSAQNIIRRLIAYDLAPNVYYSAGIRIILASVISLVLSFTLGAEGGMEAGILNLKASLPAIAFLTGMFPERVLQYLIKLYKHFISGDTINSKVLSLYHIEGISMSHKERLEEIGIDNAQNLATASLTQLLIETPYGARQLLDWIGQAKLLCYTKEDIEKLRKVGIRTVFDLLKGGKSRQGLAEISEAIGINTPLLQVIYQQVLDDQGINNLFHFHQQINNPLQDGKTAIPDSGSAAENLPIDETRSRGSAVG